MHLKNEVLRAFFDNELPLETRKLVNEHLARCSKCSARLQEIEQIADRATHHLNALSPRSGEAQFDPHIALKRFQSRKEKPMPSFFRRPIWAAAALAVILGLALLFPPVRALAGSFLGLFRVQQVQVISFDPAALEKYNTSDASGRIQAFFDKNMTVKRQGEFSQVNSVQEAANLAGFTPRLPSTTSVNSLGITPGQTIEVNIDSQTMNTGLESFGFADVKIPANLDGQKIEITVPSAVSAGFGDCPTQPENGKTEVNLAGCITFIQLPSPTIKAPDSFPVVQLGEVVLQVLGMSPAEAHKVSESIDWSSTLILPVPTGQGARSRDIEVDGVKGTIITETSNDQYVIIWVKDGILYGMSGQGTPAFRLIENLQ